MTMDISSDKTGQQIYITIIIIIKGHSLRRACLQPAIYNNNNDDIEF